MRSFVPRPMMALALAAAVALPACSASARQTAVRDTVAALSAAQAGLAAADAAAIDRAVARATSKVEGLAALEAVDRQYQAVQKALDAAWRATAIAASLDTDASLASMTAAAAEAARLVGALKDGGP